MMLAIESLVRMIETLLMQRPLGGHEPGLLADNDNDDASDEMRRRAAFR